jgi:hypothetical protein
MKGWRRKLSDKAYDNFRIGHVSVGICLRSAESRITDMILCRMPQKSMSTFRYMLSWFYWLLGVFNACVAVIVMPDVIMHPKPGGPHPLGLLIPIGMGVFIFAAALVFLMTWWVLRNDSIAGKRWVIAASLINLFVAVGVSILFLRIGGTAGFLSGVKLFAIPVIFGIAGLFAFPNSSSPPDVPLSHASHTLGP